MSGFRPEINFFEINNIVKEQILTYDDLFKFLSMFFNRLHFRGNQNSKFIMNRSVRTVDVLEDSKITFGFGCNFYDRKIYVANMELKSFLKHNTEFYKIDNDARQMIFERVLIEFI